jgi:Flp pilus assembly protein TadG
MLMRALSMHRRFAQLGQVLPLFALFLVVLLGAAALAIDYGSWLLTDRALQNVADHAALAGASQFGQRQTQASCGSGTGIVQCSNARTHAWASISVDLGLGLSDASITQLATANTLQAGQTSITVGGVTQTFRGHTVWVSTPPPSYQAYTSAGGRYSNNFGIMFVRVDRPTQSLLGGVFGLRPGPRTGWATAGALPTDFALQTFCRNNLPPQSGVCNNSAGLTIDGQGGITLLRGDIASNETLKVTANTGNGVVVQSGNVFLVNGTCGSSSWSCPNNPAQGGISDGTAGGAKNAFYMAPLPVPHYASPLDDVTITDSNCTGADATHLCVPFRPAGATSPGDWSCTVSGGSNLCGQPLLGFDASGGRTVSCTARVGGPASPVLLPSSDGSGANGFTGVPSVGSNQAYTRLDDDPAVPDPDTTTPPVNPSTDYLYSGNLGVSGGGATSVVTFNLRPPNGIPAAGLTTVRYVGFKTNGANPDDTGNPVTLSVALLQGGTSIAVDPTTRTLSGTTTRYEFTVSSAVITDYTNLSLRFTFTSSGSNTLKRGGALSWAEAETPALQPALPAMIPPGYYHSVTIPDDACAIMDPTGTYSGLKQYQKPGIFRFGTGNDASISVGSRSFLIGDGVSLVFNPEFPNPTGGRGIIVGGDGALVLNTLRVPGTPPCTPSSPEALTYNPSSPLSNLPYSSVCAAFAVDSRASTGVHAGLSTWPICTDLSLAQCVDRSRYEESPTPGTYRGITFYFSTSSWPATSIAGRFSLGGGSGAQPGIAFRGVMYAPYDDVKISGGNGFDTVGQVLAWTAKFNGGSASIVLDYPYDLVPASPYLLEPTIQH